MESGFDSLSLIGSFSDSSDHIEIANSIRQQLGLAENNTYRPISVEKCRGFVLVDDLETWCRINLPANFFYDTSTVMSEYSSVSVWAASKASHYLPNAISEFLDAAFSG